MPGADHGRRADETRSAGAEIGLPPSAGAQHLHVLRAAEIDADFRFARRLDHADAAAPDRRQRHRFRRCGAPRLVADRRAVSVAPHVSGAMIGGAGAVRRPAPTQAPVFWRPSRRRRDLFLIEPVMSSRLRSGLQSAQSGGHGRRSARNCASRHVSGLCRSRASALRSSQPSRPAGW